MEGPLVYWHFVLITSHGPTLIETLCSDNEVDVVKTFESATFTAHALVHSPNIEIQSVFVFGGCASIRADDGVWAHLLHASKFNNP